MIGRMNASEIKELEREADSVTGLTIFFSSMMRRPLSPLKISYFCSIWLMILRVRLIMTLLPTASNQICLAWKNLLFRNVEGHADGGQVDGRNPETEPLALADLVAVYAVKLLFFIVDVELIR